jgi:hypothetical protein
VSSALHKKLIITNDDSTTSQGLNNKRHDGAAETRKRWSQEKKGCSRENNLCASYLQKRLRGWYIIMGVFFDLKLIVATQGV